MTDNSWKVREKFVRNEAIIAATSSTTTDPWFYVTKQYLREKLENPPLIEIASGGSIIVIDHDLTKHVI